MEPVRRALRLLLSALGAIALTPPPAGADPTPELTVFAAASLSDALGELAKRHQAATGTRVFLNLAASSTLARQIEAGAPADVFFSADAAKMDQLERQGMLLPGTRTTLLSNTLVIVAPADAAAPVRAPQDLLSPQVRTLALAEPESVPAGIYAREYLTRLGLWEPLRAKVVPTENVRAALAAVEAGNADAGIVYQTDAAISRRVRVAYAVPRAEAPEIVYPAAVLAASRDPVAARRFLEFLGSPEATAVFRRHGFLMPSGASTP